ncbi:hypothetical protein ES705_14100 [subsurface metagenome]
MPPGHRAGTVIMAKLTGMPSMAIIDGFKGNVDFYVYMGVPVARAWPRSPGRHRAAAVEARWPSFTQAAREWKNLSPEMQAFYNKWAEGSGLSGRDLQVRAYLTGLYRYPLE